MFFDSLARPCTHTLSRRLKEKKALFRERGSFAHATETEVRWCVRVRVHARLCLCIRIQQQQ